MKIQFLFELRLANQDDLHEFLRRCLQVREHTEIFEGLDRHVLGFVYDESDVAVPLVFVYQRLMELVDHLEEIVGGELATEFSINGYEEVFKGYIGIEDVDGSELFRIYPFQIRTQDSRFAKPDFSGNRDKPLALFDAVDDGAQGCLMAGAQEEKCRIRGNMER